MENELKRPRTARSRRSPPGGPGGRGGPDAGHARVVLRMILRCCRLAVRPRLPSSLPAVRSDKAVDVAPITAEDESLQEERERAARPARRAAARAQEARRRARRARRSPLAARPRLGRPGGARRGREASCSAQESDLRRKESTSTSKLDELLKMRGELVEARHAGGRGRRRAPIRSSAPPGASRTVARARRRWPSARREMATREQALAEREATLGQARARDLRRGGDAGADRAAQGAEVHGAATSSRPTRRRSS